MKMSKILRFILPAILSSCFLLSAMAQTDTIRFRGVQSLPGNVPPDKDAPKFAGMAVSFDLAGAVMALATSYGQYEGAIRANFKHRYFPVVELGLGVSEKEDDGTELKFKTSALYARIGLDYNFAKDWRTGNRIFGGVRVAYTNFKYDLTSSDIIDPVWNTPVPINFKDVKSDAIWGELVFGLEAKIWKIIHLGWTARYKHRFHQKVSEPGQAWYIPGFGKNDSHVFGATFNFIVDI